MISNYSAEKLLCRKNFGILFHVMKTSGSIAFARFDAGNRVVIELTGGKKTMGSQLAIAAGLLEQNSSIKIDVCYIDYDTYCQNIESPSQKQHVYC